MSVDGVLLDRDPGLRCEYCRGDMALVGLEPNPEPLSPFPMLAFYLCLRGYCPNGDTPVPFQVRVG